jgi:hypothetical protein
MTPAEALAHLDKGDVEFVPAIYCSIPRPMLRLMVKEIGLDAVSPDAAGPAGPQPADPSATGLAPPSVQALLRRAIARPERLRSPARRRVAFLQHYAGSRNLIEASARAGIDRRTVNRWRKASPAFDRHLNQIACDRHDDAYEHALQMVCRPTMRPVYYCGQKVGEYEVPNTALALYVLKQADADLRRDEDRRLAAEKAAEATAFGEGVERGRARALEMRRRQQEEEAERRKQEAAAAEARLGEMSHPPGNEKMSHSVGHRFSPAERAPATSPHSAPSVPRPPAVAASFEDVLPDVDSSPSLPRPIAAATVSPLPGRSP